MQPQGEENKIVKLIIPVMKKSCIIPTAERHTVRLRLLVTLILFLFQGLTATHLLAKADVLNPDEITLASLRLEDVQGKDERKMNKTRPEEIHVIRTVNPLWQLELPDNHLPAVTTEYSVTGNNGKPDVFSNIDDPSSSVKIRIEAKGIRSRAYVNKHWLMSEVVDIIIYPVAATSRGAYSGVIKTIISFAHI